MNVTEVDKDEDQFQYELDEQHELIVVFGQKYGAGYVLRELDPTAFRCALSDRPIQYECGECSRVYEEDEADEAEECCKPECNYCGGEHEADDEQDCPNADEQEEEQERAAASPRGVIDMGKNEWCDKHNRPDFCHHEEAAASDKEEVKMRWCNEHQRHCLKADFATKHEEQSKT